MIFAFSDYELDEACFELRRAGRPIELQPKVLELLLHLVRNRDRVVPKQEILETVWPDSAVTDGSLARAVSLARLALGDRGVEPAIILTVPRRGYRFQATVRAVARRPPGVGSAAAEEDDPASRYVGRALLLARLEAYLDGALGGRGRILLLTGEAGIGKTRTAEILLERARRAGARVATAWGLEDGAPPYESWARILRVLAEEVPEALASLLPGQRSDLARLVPELGQAHDALAAPTHSGEVARFRLFEAVHAFLARCAEPRPLALFFDDLHRADSGSLGLLASFGQAIGRQRIAILATCRQEDVGLTAQHARALERLRRLTSLEHWPLEGLRGEELREFVRVRLDRPPDPQLVGALEQKTGGNPFLLRESLRSLELRGLLGEPRSASAWEALLPGGIQHLLRPKLRWLSSAAIAVLASAAAIAEDLDRALLAGCLDGTPDLDASLEELATSGLLLRHGSRLRFPHALVREALYAELVPPGEARRALHARVATALERQAGESDESLGERARHACEAAPLFDPERAAGLARRAAEQAARLHELDLSAVWYRRALDVLERARTADAAERAGLWLGLGAAQTRAVGLQQARASFRAAAHHARSAGRSDLLAAAALGFAHRPSGTGYGEPEVIELLEEALDVVATGHEGLRIRLQSRLAGELRYAERSRAEALVDTAVEAARRLGDRAVLAQALDDCSFVRWSPADPEGWIELNAEIGRAAQASNDLELLLRGQKGRVTGFLEVGDLAAVDREIRACEQTAEALRTPYARWLCAALPAMRALLDGELDDAERRVGDAILLGERVESSEVVLELQAQLVYLRLEQGRAGEIESAARAQVQRFPDAPAWRASLARILTAAGRIHEARQELERLGQGRFADVPRDRGWLPTLAIAAEVAAATGDVRAAELLEPLLLPYARLGVVAGSGLLYYGAVAHHLGLLACARSHWTAALSHLEAALLIEHRAGARVWEARTRLACARALLGCDARGERPRAVRLVAEALATARSHGLAELASDARDLETALWTGRGGSPGLGPSGLRGGGRVRDSES